VTLAQSSAVRSRRGALRQAVSASRSDSGWSARRAKYAATGLAGSTPPSSARRSVAPAGLEDVPAHPEGDDPPETAGPVGGQAEQQPGPEGETDGVEGAVAAGQPLGDVALEIGVGGRVAGLVGRAVAEDVDGHDLPAGVGQQVEPAVLAPGAGRGGGEAVEEYDGDRRGHLGPVAYLGTSAYL